MGAKDPPGFRPLMADDRREPGREDAMRAWVSGAAGTAAAVVLAAAVPASALDDVERSCSATARAAFQACRYETEDDYWVAVAKCTNLSDDEQREDCLEEAGAERREHRELCDAQRKERLKVCGRLGEAPYDPSYDPADFDADFTNLTRPNPYFPLVIGNRWELRGGTEVDRIEVRNETKRIEGLDCIVFGDRVTEAGALAEDTDDWYCMAKNGDVHYLGEEVKNYESFPGDDPMRAELVSIDGRFKSGVNRDKGGIILPAAPFVGQFYREEFSLGNAEDTAEVRSITYGYGADADLDRFVPRALVDRFCAADCLVTDNTSQLEPGVVGRKYYARGVGFFLEVKPDSGETLQLTDCNFDPRCVGLPMP